MEFIWFGIKIFTFNDLVYLRTVLVISMLAK